MPDFKTLRDGYPQDRDYPERTHRLLALTRVLDGTLYDELKYAFSEEKNKADEYLPLAWRRPSTRTRFCHTVVSDSVSLLFSEGHFPAIDCEDEATREALETVVKEASLNLVMINAATRGSVGSVCILLRVLNARVFIDVMSTAYLKPTWQEKAPDTLESVKERYKIKGAALQDAGYTIADDDLRTEFWFQRIWDQTSETWYVPQKVKDAKKKDAQPPQVDTTRTVKHSFGFVPMVWVKNLPGGDDVDGCPTFPTEAIDTQIEADYLLSQGGRGLKYQSDPTLHIKEPAFNPQGQGALVKGAANAIITGAEGDAKLLEITGDSATAVMEWVKALRELALEGMGGNRSNADKLSAAQSGRAMELMNQSLIWLADKLRISYGEGALLDLLLMVVKASDKFPLKNKKGDDLGKIDQKVAISLKWPPWYPPTYADKQTQATTLDTLRGGGLMSQETAVESLAEVYDIEDVKKELTDIASDKPPPNSIAAKPQKPPLSESND
jgi:hypothetical protein